MNYSAYCAGNNLGIWIPIQCSRERSCAELGGGEFQQIYPEGRLNENDVLCGHPEAVVVWQLQS